MNVKEANNTELSNHIWKLKEADPGFNHEVGGWEKGGGGGYSCPDYHKSKLGCKMLTIYVLNMVLFGYI